MQSNSRTFSSDHMIKTGPINETVTMEIPHRCLGSSCLIRVTKKKKKIYNYQIVKNTDQINLGISILTALYLINDFSVHEIINCCQNIFQSAYAFYPIEISHLGNMEVSPLTQKLKTHRSIQKVEHADTGDHIQNYLMSL